MEKKLFESIYILKIAKTKEEQGEIFEGIRGKLSKFKIEKIENLGIKKLAYTIKGNEKGYYVIIEFYGTDEDIPELKKFCRENDNILKSIFVNK